MEPVNLLHLPYLPLLKVFRYLDDKSLIRAHLVCKFLRRFVVENRLRFVESPFDRLYLDQIASRDGLAPPLMLVMRRIRVFCSKNTKLILSTKYPETLDTLFDEALRLLENTLSFAMMTDDRESVKQLSWNMFSWDKWIFGTTMRAEDCFTEIDFEEFFYTIKFRVGDVNGESTCSRIASKKVFVREIKSTKAIDEQWRIVTDSMRELYKFFERHS